MLAMGYCRAEAYDTYVNTLYNQCQFVAEPKLLTENSAASQKTFMANKSWLPFLMRHWTA